MEFISWWWSSIWVTVSQPTLWILRECRASSHSIMLMSSYLIALSKKKKKKKNLGPLAAVQPRYSISLLRGIVPGGYTRDQLSQPGLWRPHQPGQLEGRRSSPHLTELQPGSPSLFKRNAVDMQCPLVVFDFSPSLQDWSISVQISLVLIVCSTQKN